MFSCTSGHCRGHFIMFYLPHGRPKEHTQIGDFPMKTKLFSDDFISMFILYVLLKCFKWSFHFLLQPTLWNLQETSEPQPVLAVSHQIWTRSLKLALRSHSESVFLGKRVNPCQVQRSWFFWFFFFSFKQVRYEINNQSISELKQGCVYICTIFGP